MATDQELEFAANNGARELVDAFVGPSTNGDRMGTEIDSVPKESKPRRRTARASSKKPAAKKGTRKKSTRTARAPIRTQTVSEVLSDLPDLQEELEASPKLQRRTRQLAKELAHEFQLLVKRLMRLSPAYKTKLAVPEGLQDSIGGNVDSIVAGAGGEAILKRLQKVLPGEMIDLDTLRGMWTMLKFTGEYQADILKRRMTGDYETDEWGMDQEFTDAVIPFFDFMYHKYWRVELSGLENIPDAGRTMLVSNHSGQLPFDGAMLLLGIMQQHSTARYTRALYASWFPTLPFLSDLLVKFGQVMANDENAQRLLEQDHLVAVFPEGYKGVGKLYKDRYHLARFGRGGFVRVCLKTGAPMIPVSVVGAEETYISLHKSETLAKLIGFPYFPISPTFPWLGLFGLVPLPTKWYIDIGEPIPTDQYPEGSENNLMLISQLTDQVRDTVQNMINARLRLRKSVFTG